MSVISVCMSASYKHIPFVIEVTFGNWFYTGSINFSCVQVDFGKCPTCIFNASLHTLKVHEELFSKSTCALILHVFKTFSMCAGSSWEKIYVEHQCVTSYIGATCMDFLNVHLDVDSTCVRHILRKVVIKALFKCQHQACSYVTYFLLRRLNNLVGLTLTVELRCAQYFIWFSVTEIILLERQQKVI